MHEREIRVQPLGNGQLLGFMSGEDVEGFNRDFDSGINAGLGLPKSIYFTDPNGLQLEYCHLLREFVADDAVPRVRFRTDGRRKLPSEG